MLSLLGDVNNLNGMKSPDVHPTENISANHGSLFIASVADTVDNHAHENWDSRNTLKSVSAFLF